MGDIKSLISTKLHPQLNKEPGQYGRCNHDTEGATGQEVSDSDKDEDVDEEEAKVAEVEATRKRINRSPSRRQKKTTTSGDEAAPSARGSGPSGNPMVAPLDLQRTASSIERIKKKKTTDTTARRGKARRGKMKDISTMLKIDPIPNPYVVARSYLHLEICLSKPLLPKIPTPRKLLKPSDYIPKRPPLPRYFQMKEATEEYNSQISSIVADLAVEYKRLFQHSNQEGNSTKEERRKRMTFELNDGGSYFVMKEKLKKSIVRIVKEKFQFQLSNTRNPKELEAFINELYVYLVDQMHATLQQTLTTNTVFVKQSKIAPAHPLRVSPPNSRRFPKDHDKACAYESELLCRYSQASSYYQTQVVRSGDPRAWATYGIYASRTGDRAKAHECLREAIALDDTNADSLAAYGVLMFDAGSLDKAEVFLRAALAAQPNDPVLAYLLLKLHTATHHDEDIKEVAAISDEHPDVNLQTVKYLLELNVPTLAEQMLSDVTDSANTLNSARTNLSVNATSSQPGIPHLLSMGQVLLQKGDFASATYCFTSLTSRAPRDPAVWALGGHINYMRRNTDQGISCFEMALSCIEEPSAASSIPAPTLTWSTPSFSIFSKRAIYLRLGDLYLDKPNYNSAKTVLLKACSEFASSAAWFGTGVALYHLGSYSEAEEALAEANIHDNAAPRVWGYLALLCLKTQRSREATQAFKLALRLRLSDPSLLCDIGECYLASGNADIAEECARAAHAHHQEQHAARSRVFAQGAAHAHAYAQDRWQCADATQKHYPRADELLARVQR